MNRIRSFHQPYFINDANSQEEIPTISLTVIRQPETLDLEDNHMINSPLSHVLKQIRTIIRRKFIEDQEPMHPCASEQSESTQPETVPQIDQATTQGQVEPSNEPILVEKNSAQEETCKSDGLKFCPKEMEMKAIWNVFQCLQNHLEELTPSCKEKVEHSPIFNCAMDAMKFCSNIPQASIPGCLRQNFKDLSNNCTHQIVIHSTPVQRDVESVSSATETASSILLIPHDGGTWTGRFLNMFNATTVAKVVSILVFLSLLVICSAVVYLCAQRKRGRQRDDIQLQILQPPIIA